MKVWMFNCREVSRLVSESMDRDLGILERTGIRFHLMMCRHCARFGQQLRWIRNMIRSQGEEVAQPLKMDPISKEELKKLLRKSRKSEKS
jgi:hypothetical protein